MGLSTYRWAVIDDDETTIVCAETIDEVIDEVKIYQPTAIIRLGFAKWNDEKREYE